jgi:diacylglycerol kinase (ATP)
MLRVGVLSSPGYRNMKGGLGRLERFLSERSGVPHLHVESPFDVKSALGELDHRGVDVVAVSGGDGTVSMVLTCLLRHYAPEDLPLVAVLAGGRTNMSAGDVGLKGNQARQLARLLSWAEKGNTGHALVRRPVLGVHGGDDPNPLFGLFFGAGAILYGCVSTWKFRAESRLPGMRTEMGTGVHVAKLLFTHFTRGNAFDPTRIAVRLDENEIPVKDYTTLFVTTLDRMIFGMRPFWGPGSGPLRFTSILHPHRHFMKACFHALRGRTNRFVSEDNGYFSQKAEEVELQVDAGGALDGELISRPKGGSIRIRADRQVTFVQPTAPCTLPESSLEYLRGRRLSLPVLDAYPAGISSARR